MRIARKLHATALATAAVAVAGLLGPAATPAAAATVIPVPNPSFEDGWSGGKLNCWNIGSTTTAHLTVTQGSHSGSWAAYASGLTLPTDKVELSTDHSDACQVPVVPGRAYTFGYWGRSTLGMQAVVSAYTAAGGWKRWYTGPALLPTTDLRSYALNLPTTPADVTRLSLGWTFPGTGAIVADDISLTERTTDVRLTFGQSGIVTNEYAYWNPTDPTRANSPDWEMTSGSLFARSGNGYSGTVDATPPDATSSTSTDSSVFRLNTKNFSFGNARVSMNLNIAKLATTSRTPAVDWDGVHIFLHYQSQYELYYASVARRDGHVVIKKKCLGGPSNGGSYYALGTSELSGMPFSLGVWHAVGASVRTNADGSVTIVLFRDGKAVTSATDTGVGCAPITKAGATGIRGDNAEFSFNNFTVTPLA